MGGVANSTGRLEFCAHGVWGRVCNALGDWSLDNASLARVVCRALGFSQYGEILALQHHSPIYTHPYPTGAYVIDHCAMIDSQMRREDVRIVMLGYEVGRVLTMAMLSFAMTEYGEVSVVMDGMLTTLGLFAGT